MVDAQLSARTLDGPPRRVARAGLGLHGARRPHPPAHPRRAHPHRHPAARRARTRRAASASAAPRSPRPTGSCASSASCTACAARAASPGCQGSPAMLSVPGDRGYLDLSKAAMPALPWLVEAAGAASTICRATSAVPASTRSECPSCARPSPTATRPAACRPRRTRSWSRSAPSTRSPCSPGR